MEITINGESKKFESLPSLQKLIEALNLDPQKVIAEVNKSIIKKENWNEFSLNDGDKIELVSFVGGG